MWAVLSIAALLSLVLFWRAPNAVWGGVVLGAVGGFVTSLVRNGLSWLLIGKGIVVGVLFGLLAEVVGRLARRTAKTS